MDIQLPAAISLLADSHGEYDWPMDVGQAARTQVALQLAEAGKAGPGFLSPVQVVRAARSHVPRETVVTVDAGAHMLAVMPLWEVTEPRRLLISSGLATMGFALPAAIAAALCAPAQLVVAFTGDGGLGMTMAEIETAARLRLRIAVVVFNDGALSLIKIKQQPAGQGGAEAVDFGPVSYARAAEAMGAAAVTVSTETELAAALSAACGPARSHGYRRPGRPGGLCRDHGPEPGRSRPAAGARAALPQVGRDGGQATASRRHESGPRARAATVRSTQ